MADFEQYINLLVPDATEEERELMRLSYSATNTERCKQTIAAIRLQLDRIQRTMDAERETMSTSELLKWEQLVSNNIAELRRWDETLRAQERLDAATAKR